MSAEGEALVRLAAARLFNDNPQRGDAMVVLAYFAQITGYYDVPSIAAWTKQLGTPQGYEISCHELNGKRAVFKTLTDFASLSQSDLVRLERIARGGGTAEEE